MMCARIISFIETHDILYNYKTQYGFQKPHFTEHAILDIVNSVQSNMDKGLFSCGIFIEKSF